MTTVLTYLLYAFLLIAVVLGVEGVWLSLRGHLGEERTINRRLSRVHRKLEGRSRTADGLQQWLQRRAPRLQAALQRAKSPLPASQVVLGSAALAAALFFGLTALGVATLAAIVVAVGLGVAAPAVLISGLIRRRRRRFLEQLPQAVDLIARSLQVGHPVTAAMSVVAEQMSDPIGPEFATVIEEITYGLDRDAALANLLQRFPAPELRMFVASMQVTRDSGGNLAEVFLKLAESIRAKAHLRRKAEAISAEGRLSFWVVTSLPIIVGGALILLRPSFYTEVMSDPLFWPMMSFAPVTLVVGAMIIWRLVNFRI